MYRGGGEARTVFELNSLVTGWHWLVYVDLLLDCVMFVYIRSTTVYVPSSELGLSQPLSRQRVCPSPQNRGEGGAHSPAGAGLGESQFRRLEKKLSILPTLWCTVTHIENMYCLLPHID
jgi:hypothetical protein